MFGRLYIGYWLLLALTAVEITTGYAVGVTVGNVEPAAFVSIGGLRKMLPPWVILPLLWLGYVVIVITWRRIDRPTAVLLKVLHRHRFWLLRGLLLTLLALVMGRAFSAYKSSIADLVPYYADPFLVAADKALFLGVDPWRLTHAVIGPLGTLIIDRVYALWFMVMMLLLGWFNFTRNQKLQLRGLLTYLLAWALLGNLIATSLSSVGPCFYQEFYRSDYYAPLMSELRATNETHRLLALGGRDYLLEAIGKDRLGAGISAMPSLHVSIAFLCWLVTLEYARHMWFKVLAGTFAAIIFVGSVHLAWHYALDGIVSMIGTALIWFGAGRFVDWLDRRQSTVGDLRQSLALSG